MGVEFIQGQSCARSVGGGHQSRAAQKSLHRTDTVCARKIATAMPTTTAPRSRPFKAAMAAACCSEAALHDGIQCPKHLHGTAG